MKTCTRCGKTKDIKDFYKNKKSKDNYDNTCKECKNIDYKKWYKSVNGQEKTKRYTKEYYKRDGIKDKMREYRILKTFNLKKEEFDILKNEQNNLCAICLKEEDCSRHKHLSIDHNHKTGKIRGLLCNKCNKALGQFKDNIEFLERAITYLKKYK